MTRRVFLPTAAATPLAMAAASKGRLKQSVCRWCYKDIQLEDLNAMLDVLDEVASA